MRTSPRPAALAALLACTACDPSVATEDGRDAGATSGCDQSCQDFNAALAIQGAVDFLYNQTMPGKAAGRQDVSASCAAGGTVHITGTTTVDGTRDVTQAHLVFDMTGCRSTGGNYDVTVTGKLFEDGTFGATTTALAYRGSGLSLAGFAGGGVAKLEGTCDVSITRNGTTASGTYCGRGFSGVSR
jgi:hypothetical protein